MIDCVIVTGIEDSGNRMWTKFLAENHGFDGDWGDEGAVSRQTRGWWVGDAETGPTADGTHRIVINTSWPHGPKGNGPPEFSDAAGYYFPDPLRAAACAKKWGWSPGILLCVRDFNIVCDYMTKARRGGDRASAAISLAEGLRLSRFLLGGWGTPVGVASFEAVTSIGDPYAHSVVREMGVLGDGSDGFDWRNENRKWVAREGFPAACEDGSIGD